MSKWVTCKMIEKFPIQDASLCTHLYQKYYLVSAHASCFSLLNLSNHEWTTFQGCLSNTKSEKFSKQDSHFLQNDMTGSLFMLHKKNLFAVDPLQQECNLIHVMHYPTTFSASTIVFFFYQQLFILSKRMDACYVFNVHTCTGKLVPCSGYAPVERISAAFAVVPSRYRLLVHGGLLAPQSVVGYPPQLTSDLLELDLIHMKWSLITAPSMLYHPGLKHQHVAVACGTHRILISFGKNSTSYMHLPSHVATKSMENDFCYEWNMVQRVWKRYVLSKSVEYSSRSEEGAICTDNKQNVWLLNSKGVYLMQADILKNDDEIMFKLHQRMLMRQLTNVSFS